nr:ribonuclease H-like domain-containing protein [Tanacetum cinerariifolium]
MPYQQKRALTNKRFREIVNIARPMLVNTAEPVNTARPRPVNTVGPTSTVVNDIKATCLISLILRNLMEDMLPLEEEKMVAELLLKELLKLDIVPSGDLTRLFAKAIIDESNLWHRRLGLMHKKYRLVVTDDYSRYTWVFFLASKDETSGILKKFITEIENLIDKKVKNRALVVKPHNKTPYELFKGRTPALSFMRPYGCHVTILNILNHLGINFDDFASIKDSIGADQSNMETGSTQDYIYMPLWKDSSLLFDSSLKLSDDAGSPSSSDAGKKHDEVFDKESGASNELNYAFENVNTEYPDYLKILV